MQYIPVGFVLLKNP